MSAIVVTSAVNHRRIGRARAWLESRVVAEEVLIVGASLDAANELARTVGASGKKNSRQTQFSGG